MKRIIILVICLIILLPPFKSFANAPINNNIEINLGFDILKNAADIQSVDSEIKGYFKKDDIALKINNYLYYKKYNSIKEEDIANNEIQAMFFNDPIYLFLNGSDNKYRSLDIDEINIGLGIGYKKSQQLLNRIIDIEAQTGLFIRDKATDDDYCSKSNINLAIPLRRIINLEEAINFDIDTQDNDDYRFISDTAFIIKTFWAIGLRTGVKISYNNLSDISTAKHYYYKLSYKRAW